jgi:hypothetical protein
MTMTLIILLTLGTGTLRHAIVLLFDFENVQHCDEYHAAINAAIKFRNTKHHTQWSTPKHTHKGFTKICAFDWND